MDSHGLPARSLTLKRLPDVFAYGSSSKLTQCFGRIGKTEVGDQMLGVGSRRDGVGWRSQTAISKAGHE